jgi:hypothetical protein
MTAKTENASEAISQPRDLGDVSDAINNDPVQHTLAHLQFGSSVLERALHQDVVALISTQFVTKALKIKTARLNSGASGGLPRRPSLRSGRAGPVPDSLDAGDARRRSVIWSRTAVMREPPYSSDMR